MTTVYTFAITGMHCASCGMLIDETLEELPGVTRSTTSLRERRTTVEAEQDQATPEAVIAAIAEAGYTATWEQP
jgi:copper chaperone CopZ